MAPEVRPQVLPPTLLAAGGLEADQVPAHAQRVEELAVEGRSRARARVVHPLGGADGDRPDLLPILLIERDHALVFADVPHGEDAPAGDRDARVTISEA